MSSSLYVHSSMCWWVSQKECKSVSTLQAISVFKLTLVIMGSPYLYPWISSIATSFIWFWANHCRSLSLYYRAAFLYAVLLPQELSLPIPDIALNTSSFLNSNSTNVSYYSFTGLCFGYQSIEQRQTTITIAAA